jgi:hypothetical protein
MYLGDATNLHVLQQGERSTLYLGDATNLPILFALLLLSLHTVVLE